jgi:hypothetical protein
MRTKLTVGVCAFNFETDKTEKVGTITYDGKQVRASNLGHPFMQSVFKNPVFESDAVNERLRAVYKDSEPELFMHLLCVEYHGSYAFCERTTKNGKLKSVEEVLERLALSRKHSLKQAE